ncbi:MAG TPA: hypothetical protein VN742_09635 [Candidatus Binataceae bacterium]|nr:hypothetical protein [Candidatus Binataceae bacterium]
MKRKWSAARTVNVPRMMSGDQKIFWLYSLTLCCNRHVSDDWSDDEVSSALNKMRERMPLPYGFNFEAWETPE